MDEFGSPIAGGIRAVRRSVSSSVFRPVQRQEPVQPKPDPITTNLLSQNSLSLTNISQQLQNVSAQVASLNFSLNGIKDNLALSDSLERQREAARQARERILAEQGLREGKEGTLERKIQTALTSPLRRVAAKTQGILARLQEFFLIIAGGWLTASGIDLLQAMSEGNIDKINEYKNKFLKGLLVIGAAFTALQVGIGVTINLLGRFVGTVARVAFGGILRGAFRGVKRLISGVIAQIIGGGIGGALAGAGSGTVSGAVAGAGGSVAATSIAEEIKSFRKIAAADPDLSRMTPQQLAEYNRLKKITPSGGMPKGNVLPDGTVKGFFGRSVDKIKGFFGSKTATTTAKTATTTATKTAAKEGAKKAILKFLTSGAKKFLNILKIGGPFLTFFINLASGEGIGGALAAVAGFAAGAAGGAKIGASIGGMIGTLFGGIGAIPGAAIGGFLGGLIGGIAGEELMKGLFRGVQRLFGIGGKSNKKEENIRELRTEDLETFDDQTTSENITPMQNNNSEIATNISEMEEGSPTVINVPLSGKKQDPPIAMGGDDSSKSNPIPSINVDNKNPHTLFATATYGV